MLYTVGHISPLGANHWALVGSRFCSWATEHERSMRTTDSIKSNFRKLANDKKTKSNTGTSAMGEENWTGNLQTSVFFYRDF